MESLAGPQDEYLATGWNYSCANLLDVFRGSTCILWNWEVWKLLTHDELPSVDPACYNDVWLVAKGFVVFCSYSPWARA